MRIRISHDAAGGYRATLKLETRDGRSLGERELDSDGTDCRDLGQAVMLAALLTIDSMSTSNPPKALHVTQQIPWRAEITPAAIVSWGRLPSPAPGLGLRAAVAPAPHWATEVALFTWPSARSADHPPRADFSGWRAALGECLRLAPLARIGLEVLPGAELNAIRGEGLGLKTAYAPVSFWAAPVAGVSGPIAVGHHLALWTAFDVALPLQRDYFYYIAPSGAKVVAFRPAALDLDAALGISVSIP